MPYDSIIDRTNDAGPLIPEDVQKEIVKGVTQESTAMQLFRKRPMSRKQSRIPVLNGLPTAYFRDGDTGLRQTSEAAWTNVYLNAEALDVIVPVPRVVLEDVDYDLWQEISPLVQEAFGIAIDAAIFIGTNKPSTWPTAIATAAASASNTVNRGTASQATGGIAKDLSDAMATVEADGYEVNGFVANPTFRSRLRAARDTTGQKLLDLSDPNAIEGQPLRYGMKGVWGTSTGSAEVFLGDFDQGIFGVREDISMKLDASGVIQDSNGAIQYNLMQQDMIAAIFTMRVAFAVPNPINRMNTNSSTRYPFAALLVP